MSLNSLLHIITASHIKEKNTGLRHYYSQEVNKRQRSLQLADYVNHNY